MSGLGTPSNPSGQPPTPGNPFVNLATLVTGVQDVVKAVYTMEQVLETLLALGGTTNTDIAAINTTLGTINTTLAAAFPTLAGAKTFDPPSIANGASSSTTVTVTGAALGKMAVPSFSLDLAGLILTAYVSSANTVTCVFGNLTGGAVDLASGTLSVKVFA